MSIRNLVENKSILDYKALTLSLIHEIGINETVNWDAVIPAAVQQNLFGGEILRLFSDHESFANQKDIRTIALKKGETSQLLILFAQLKDEKLSKAGIERITKKFIGGQAAERYVVWFLGSPDNTQFKVVLSGKEGKKIVLKTLPFGIDQPYYKTYDFILDEVHKKVSGFFVEPNELWKALWKSFDISVVNKRFYEDIKKSFDLLVNNNILSGAIRNVEARKQFVVRLIGRIIFCWFLKKKTIIDEAVLCSSAVNKYEDYYGQFLEKLFFDVFNTPQKERRKDLPVEIKNYPFLNGGLFEDQKGDFGDYKGYINIPNEWFDDLFKNTLEKYNFTIDENTSANSEIAIDPEMLGRIFENLLAEQNPETQESARKSTGSYYTPREIVDYMVEQSLIEYIKSNLNKDITPSQNSERSEEEEKNQSNTVILSEAKNLKLDQAIEDFVHTEELSDELKPYTNDILEKLNSVKVLDPACGSGAFPIGMLQKLIALKLQLTSPLTKGGIKGGSKGVYELKLSTILNSIYGCDIQPMAVELSRLRCWLSLIIDERVDKKKDNWGIENLPNLDFKFVCVNSLIELPRMVEDALGAVTKEYEKLKELRTEFFTASAKRKIEIENEFQETQKTIAMKQRDWSSKNIDAVALLVNWNPFKIEKTNWFDPFWMFGINSGFEIIIANPPYIGQKGFNHLFREVKKSPLGKFHQRRMDYFYFFFHAGINYLHNDGVLTLITTNYFLTATYADKLRNDIKARTIYRRIINFNEMKIFESALGQHNAISILIKRNGPDEICETTYINAKKFASSEILNEIFQKKYSEALYSTKLNKILFDAVNGNIYINSYSNLSLPIDSILHKLSESSDSITKYCDIIEGIHTGADKISQNHIKKYGIKLPVGMGIYVLTKKELEQLDLNVEERNIIKPWFKNSDINKWVPNEKNKVYVIYYHSKEDYKNVEHIKTYLEQFKLILINRKVRSGTGFISLQDYEDFVNGKKYISYIMNHSAFKAGNFYCISYPREKSVFEGEKIVVPQRSYNNTFAYNNGSWYASADVYFIKSINTELALKYILALLNSKLYLFLLREKGKKKGEMLELYIRPLSELPIIKNTNQKLFIDLVNLIISEKNKNPQSNTKHLEDQIDIMVYKLYNLTYEEVKIIDPDIEQLINKEDYERFQIS